MGGESDWNNTTQVEVSVTDLSLDKDKLTDRTMDADEDEEPTERSHSEQEYGDAEEEEIGRFNDSLFFWPSMARR